MKDTTTNPFNTGDIIVHRWDKVLIMIDFYRVERTTKHMIFLIKIPSIEDYRYRQLRSNPYVIPDLNHKGIGKVFRKKVIKQPGYHSKIAFGYGTSRSWDGKALKITN